MILVDSNIILDVVTQDPKFFEWSSQKLKLLSNYSILVINPIIYTEISINFKTIEEVELILSQSYFVLETIPSEACFLAGKVFLKYRKQMGTKQSTLPDFFIGAHAAVKGYSILTRDKRHYETYFPNINLITP